MDDPTSDPTAAIRADPRRPGWLRDEMLPLPVGTERVYSCGTAYPRGMWWSKGSKEWRNDHTPEATCGEAKCIVYHVPQPAPALESILGTASAAKAVEQGVADAVEGRTVKIPDPLDQLAAEAQAEGEYGTAWERWQSLRGAARDNGHKIRLFNAFIAAECKRAVERAKASPRLSRSVRLWRLKVKWDP